MTATTVGVVMAGHAPDDPHGFTAWVRPHLTAMSRLAARLTSDAERDDVVQDALTRAWRKRKQYDEGRGTAQAWLLAIVAGEARRHRVRRRPTVELFEGDTPSYTDSSHLDLERALARLTDRQRLAVDLYYFVGLDVAETAAVLGCSTGTVKSTLSDARGKLRGLLEVQP